MTAETRPLGTSEADRAPQVPGHGITAFLANGGELTTPRWVAGYESPRTARLYDRTPEEISRDEIEHVLI